MCSSCPLPAPLPPPAETPLCLGSPRLAERLRPALCSSWGEGPWGPLAGLGPNQPQQDLGSSCPILNPWGMLRPFLCCGVCGSFAAPLHGGGWESGAAPAARLWCRCGGCGAGRGPGTMSPATAWSEGTNEQRGSGLGRGWLLTKWRRMWEELPALLFFGISRKGWRSESEKHRLCWGRGSPGLAVPGGGRAGPVQRPHALARGPAPCFLPRLEVEGARGPVGWEDAGEGLGGTGSVPPCCRR